jgi:hypothetical protein
MSNFLFDVYRTLNNDVIKRHLEDAVLVDVGVSAHVLESHRILRMSL